MSVEITPELLADLKKKAGSATSGPWRVRIQEVQNSCTGRLRRASWIVRTDGSHLPYNDDDGIANNEHIAAANPAVVLALVAEVERLRLFQAVAVEVIDKLNIYHECSDPDQCRSCEQINAGIEAISKAKREASNADQA